MKTLLALLATLFGFGATQSSLLARDHSHGHSRHHSSNHHSGGHHRGYHSAPRYIAPRFVQPAGYYVTRVAGYDCHGHPIYRRVWVSGYSHGGYCR